MKNNKNYAKVATDILIEFTFIKSKDEFLEAYNRIFKIYGLCSDPFTHTPCTPEEYHKNKLEYDKQIMTERYGHCDGLN